MVGNEKIEETNSFKMLGFMVDNNLNNDRHCHYIIKKSRKLYQRQDFTTGGGNPV